MPRLIEKLARAALALWLILSVARTDAAARWTPILKDDDPLWARIEKEDRGELVTPAPKEFAPESVDRNLALDLTIRDARIPNGGAVWYRLKAQNVGRLSILFNQDKSFFKDGNEEESRYRFLVTPPGGTEEEVVTDSFPAYFHGIPFNPKVPQGDKLTKQELLNAEEKIKADMPYKYARGFSLKLSLAPGETLRTRSWANLHEGQYDRLRQGLDPYPVVPGEYRELSLMDFKFDKPGIYRIRVRFRANPSLRPPDEEEIQEGIKLGLEREWQLNDHQRIVNKYPRDCESNVVEVEVLP